MGDITQQGNNNVDNLEQSERSQSVTKWSFGSGEGSWQGCAPALKFRTGHLYNSAEMSDLSVTSCDENWWFGETVKDFNGHKFLLGSASPVLHKILYDWPEDSNNDQDEKRQLILDESVEVVLTLTNGYSCQRLEIDGVPPIAVEALLEYIYKDVYNEADFENGYSRNLLWRLWHASKAFEMEHLHSKCTETIHKTMCEETVFWDLNYSIKYRALGTEDIRTKVLKSMEALEEKLFEHPNFVWLERESILEILTKRKPNSCEPMTIFNNLLRWSLYQLDRSACSETKEGLTGAEIPVVTRLEWICRCRNGEFEHVTIQDMDKYLSRGLEKMPWTEMSQADFLVYVVNAHVAPDEVVYPNAIKIMEVVVNNPERLHKSAFDSQKATQDRGSGHGKITAIFSKKKDNLLESTIRG